MGLYKKGKSMLRRAGAAAKKRYMAKPGGRKSTGGVRVAKMAKDIMYLKSVLNPEKKRYTYTEANLLVGQVNGNADGLFNRDVTPVMNQGVTYDTRNGASIKLHSSIYHFQLAQQAGAVGKIKAMIEIWEVKGDPLTGFTFSNEHWDPNTFTGVRDFNCQINPDHYMKARCLARRSISVAADQTTGEKLLTDVKIPLLYNKGQGKHIRYEKDSNTVASGQMYLIIRCDRGNIATTPSGLNVPDVGINTGLIFNYNRVDYYYDN